MTQPAHTLTVTHIPLDRTGTRIHRPGDARINDVELASLREIIEGLDGDLENIHGKPDLLAIRDALHSVIAAVQDLTRRTIATHRSIADGHLNYSDDLL